MLFMSGCRTVLCFLVWVLSVSFTELYNSGCPESLHVSMEQMRNTGSIEASQSVLLLSVHKLEIAASICGMGCL